jgi:hypothetical protein
MRAFDLPVVDCDQNSESILLYESSNLLCIIYLECLRCIHFLKTSIRSNLGPQPCGWPTGRDQAAIFGPSLPILSRSELGYECHCHATKRLSNDADATVLTDRYQAWNRPRQYSLPSGELIAAIAYCLH